MRKLPRFVTQKTVKGREYYYFRRGELYTRLTRITKKGSRRLMQNA